MTNFDKKKFRHYGKDIYYADIEGFEGMYRVYSDGKVVRLSDSLLRSPKSNVPSFDGNPLVKSFVQHGTEVVTLYKPDKTQTTKSVAKIVLETFIGKNPDAVVQHKDENFRNNKLENLEWGKKASYNRKIFCEETGQIYGSIVEASRETGLSYYKIKKYCKNKADGSWHIKEVEPLDIDLIPKPSSEESLQE